MARSTLAPTLMVQGTTSHAGKTVLVAGLCRVFARRDVSVAPFKSQNMALNSAVTPEGAEIGRAQAFQAQAAGIEPHVDMNPVLLKPCSPTGSQVVVAGKPVGVMLVREYHAYQPQVWPIVTDALERLRARHELVVIEGAGSPAEINIRHRDIANMAVALHAGSPVIIVADIDRGGLFASLVGTMELLTAEERALVAGFVINRFRGDATLLDSGIAMLEERYGVPVLGVLPYLSDWRGDEEDSLGIESTAEKPGADLTIAVVRLPYVSNYTDVAALAAEPDLSIRWVGTPRDIEVADAIIIPGSKSTADDLSWMRASGIADAVIAAAEADTPVVGICGGYQMLGGAIRDPHGVEGGETHGLGLLDTETVFSAEKRTVRASGLVAEAPSAPGALAPAGTPAVGYEIHMGRTTLGAGAMPLLHVTAEDGTVYDDGAVSAQLPVCGCYLHGLFDSAALRHGWLDGLRERRGLGGIERPAVTEDPCDRLADTLEEHLDIDRIAAIAGIGVRG